jgi:hypothetical protein
MEDIRFYELKADFDQAIEEGECQLNESFYKGIEIIGLDICMKTGMTIEIMENMLEFYCKKEDYRKCSFLKKCIEKYS